MASRKTSRAGNVHEGGTYAHAIDEIDQLERLLAAHPWSDRRAFQRARKHARGLAEDLLQREGASAEACRGALLLVASELFSAMRSELVGAVETIGLIDAIEVKLGLSRSMLAREVLRAPELLLELPEVAIGAQLSLLVAFAPLRSVSLWAPDNAERVVCVRHIGEGGPTRGASELAQRVFAGEQLQQGSRRLLLGVALGRWQRPSAVLVGSAWPGMRESCAAYLQEAAPMLGAILERQLLLRANADSERTLVESSERKLTRLGFDLHDGPIQDVTALAQDLRLLWSQLEEQIADLADSTRQGERIRGRMEDVDAQVAALDSDLRRISNEVRAASVLLNRPFTSALRDVGRAFAARTNVEPRLSLKGELGMMSASQQIALLNIVHEALTNVREHSSASEVEISVAMRSDRVEAVISDNGCGFDLEATLVRAAGQGRLGLVGMHERVRLLGGRFHIDTKPGGPTTLAVALERWEPVAGGARPAVATSA